MARSEQCSVLSLVLAGLLVSQSIFFAVTCTSVEDQKNYYPSPDPHTGTGSPPTGSHGHGSPPHGSGGSHHGSPPHGSGGSHHGSPHHGSGGSHGSSPPSHGGGVGCTNPPNDPHTPSVPSHTPTPSVPSHNPTPSVPSYTPTPSVPSHTPTPSVPSHTPTPSVPSYTPTPSVPSHTPTPSVPSYTPTPSVPSHTPTPSVPSYTPTPSAPSGGYYNSPPATPTPTPVIVTPTPPSIPSITPTPFFDPNHPFTGTCTYWMNHPTLVWGVMGWWGTLGSAFGGGHSLSGFPSSLTLPQALSNTRTDGLSSLYREGTASFLNSMVNNRFHFTTQQVRDSFVAALSSDKAAAAQARVFKLANEGRLKPRA